MPRYSSATIGILCMTASMVWFSAMNIGVRWLSFEWHTTEIVLVRSLLGVFLLMPWVLKNGSEVLKTSRLKSHFWRSTIGVVGMQTWFYAISIMSLNQATALSLSAPIFTAAFAILFLGEKAGIHRWGAILCGFMGALVIIRPGSEVFDTNSLIVLGAASLWAWAGILVKSLTKTESPTLIIFYIGLFMSMWSFPLALPHLHVPTLTEFAVCIWIAIASFGAHWSLVNAYKHADIVILTPFDFSRLIFTAILAYFFFAEIPTIHSWIGGAIIVASAAYIAHRERVKKTKPKLTEAPEL